MTFTLEIDVAARPTDVFEFIADLTTMARWYSAVQRVEQLGGNGHKGTMYRVYRDLPGGRAHNDVEITVYEPPREVEFTSRRGPTPFTYRYLLDPRGDGTRLVLHGAISGEGLPGLSRLLAPMAEGLFQRGMRDNLGELQAQLEDAR